MGTWDLGTRGEGREDIKHGTQGRIGRGHGDVKYRDSGDVRTLIFIAKVQGTHKPPHPPYGPNIPAGGSSSRLSSWRISKVRLCCGSGHWNLMLPINITFSRRKR